MQPQLIALYIKGDNAPMEVTQLFVIERLGSYMIFILLLSILQLGIFIWKFISRSWSVPLAMANAAQNTVLCILLIIMLSDNSLFNSEFISKIAYYTKMPLTQITSYWTKNLWIFAAVFIAISFWDSITALVKCKK